VAISIKIKIMAFGFENPLAKKPLQEAKKEDNLDWNDKLNEQMKADGDEREVYGGEGILDGVTAEFTSVAGEISVVLNIKNPDGSTSQLNKEFTAETRPAAEKLFEELRKQISFAAVKDEDGSVVFNKVKKLFK
jgi:hypothetical protein